jgi:hypothetical protein
VRAAIDWLISHLLSALAVRPNPSEAAPQSLFLSHLRRHVSCKLIDFNSCSRKLRESLEPQYVDDRTNRRPPQLVEVRRI